MHRAAVLALIVLLMAPGLALAQAVAEGGCVQRRIGAVVQGTKLLSRCYALAARAKTPTDAGCIERADRRVRSSLERLDRAGCTQEIDTQALLDAAHAFVGQVTALIADPRPRPAVSPSGVKTPAATPQP